jgi:riboflavin transporter FmnP
MKLPVKKLVTLAMLAAMAYIMVFLVRIPVVLFLKYEPKDVVITIAGFLFGPLEAFLVSLVVSLVEMVTISDTGPIGALMNLLSTCAFACAAAAIYKRKRTLSGAILGLLVGSFLMVVVMLIWNWLITPMYMGVPRSAVEGMLLPVFLPFNLLKGGLNSVLTVMLYKPLVTTLRKVGLVSPRSSTPGSSRIGLYLICMAVLATCILGCLALAGVL